MKAFWSIITSTCIVHVKAMHVSSTVFKISTLSLPTYHLLATSQARRPQKVASGSTVWYSLRNFFPLMLVIIEQRKFWKRSKLYNELRAHSMNSPHSFKEVH